MAISVVWVLRPEYNPHLGGFIREHPYRKEGDNRTCYQELFPSVGRFSTITQLKRMVTGMILRGHRVPSQWLRPWKEDQEEAFRRGCFRFFYRSGRGVYSDIRVELEVNFEPRQGVTTHKEV